MNELLANPAVQAGVAPFFAGLVVAAVLRRSRLLGLATGAGFLTVVALAIGFSFEPLTATRKLIVIVIASLFVLVGIEGLKMPNAQVLRAGVAGAAALGALWVAFRVLTQKETGVALAYGAGAALFLFCLVYSSLHPKVAGDSVAASSTSLVLGLGVGALALLGASASLAQIGIAVGAGAGAGLLIQMIVGQRITSGWTLALPAAVAAGLIGLVAVVTGGLPWFALLPLVAVPWASAILPAGTRPVWLQSILCVLVTLIPALLAACLAWYAASLPVA